MTGRHCLLPGKLAAPAFERQARGFTLLEVVVALSILVICMTVIMRILAGSTRVAAVSSDYYSALQIAESKMAELRVQKASAGAIATGRMAIGAGADFDWVAEVRPYRSRADDPVLPVDIAEQPLAAYELMQLEVTVFWGSLHKREFRLSTLQLRSKDESKL